MHVKIIHLYLMPVRYEGLKSNSLFMHTLLINKGYSYSDIKI